MAPVASCVEPIVAGCPTVDGAGDEPGAAGGRRRTGRGRRRRSSAGERCRAVLRPGPRPPTRRSRSAPPTWRRSTEICAPARRHPAGDRAGRRPGAVARRPDRAAGPARRPVPAAARRRAGRAGAASDAAGDGGLVVPAAHRGRAAAVRPAVGVRRRLRPRRRRGRVRRATPSTRSTSSTCSARSSTSRWSSPIVDRHGTRYRLLETLRQYGEERLEGRRDRRLRDRHLDHYLDVAAGPTPSGRPLASPSADGIFDREWDNLRTSFQWAMVAERYGDAEALVIAAANHSFRRDREIRVPRLGALAVGAPARDARPHRLRLGIAALQTWLIGDVERSLDFARRGMRHEGRR